MRRIVGKYLWEWGAMVIFLQETMWDRCRARDWNGVGRGFLDRFSTINAVGRSGGMVVACNKAVFLRVDA